MLLPNPYQQLYRSLHRNPKIILVLDDAHAAGGLAPCGTENPNP